MDDTCRYGFGTDVTLGFDAAIETLEQLLDDRGFRITTRLRMDEVLNECLEESFGRYQILGACNPLFARELFRSDTNIGLMMPCNLIVYEIENGHCRVMVKDPARIMDLIDSPVAIEASMKIKEQLEEIVEIIGKQKSPSLVSRMNPFRK